MNFCKDCRYCKPHPGLFERLFGVSLFESTCLRAPLGRSHDPVTGEKNQRYESCKSQRLQRCGFAGIHFEPKEKRP